MTTYQYHTAIDEFLALSIKNSPPENHPCCSRCTVAHCCSEPAYCDADEVEYMLRTLSPEQLDYVTERTKHWLSVFAASKFINEEQPKAFEYRLMNLPCPFLTKSGLCINYANRPGDCRMFFAMGNPMDCAMPARIHQKIADWKHPNAFDFTMQRYVEEKGYGELDHIGAHLVRQLLNQPEFTTAAHQRLEIEKENTV